ncbi:MAG: SRPBCC family protein [Pseudoclavibacter sp.]
MHTPSLDISVRVEAPIELVWHAIISPDIRVQWWPGLHYEAIVGARVDGESARPGKKKPRRTRGEVTAIDHETRQLHATWESTPGHYATTFHLFVTEAKHRTKIRVIESGFPDDARESQLIVAESRDGWRRHLGNLVDYLDDGENIRAIERSYRKRQPAG